MIPIAERVEQRLSHLKGEVNVAVMGREVNGPGEAAAADVGVAYGHNGVGLLFRGGEIVKRMKAEELEDAVVDEAIGSPRSARRRSSYAACPRRTAVTIHATAAPPATASRRKSAIAPHCGAAGAAAGSKAAAPSVVRRTTSRMPAI